MLMVLLEVSGLGPGDGIYKLVGICSPITTYIQQYATDRIFVNNVLI